MTMKNDAKFEEKLTCRVLELICVFRNSMKMQMQCEKFILLWTQMNSTTMESLFLRYKKISKKVVKLGSFLQFSVHVYLGYDVYF